jgi:diguanylate cyclase (GGDEF)-like protein/PAS domain S-box-containing protein
VRSTNAVVDPGGQSPTGRVILPQPVVSGQQSLLPSIRRAQHVVTVATVALVGVLTVAALLIVRSQHREEQALADRFNTRQAVSAQFIEAYVGSVYERERAVAGRLYSGRVNPSSFAALAGDQGFDTAVLLDARGRLLASRPANTKAVTQNLGARYAHLRSAVTANTPAVSGVVPSAIRGDPVISFAVPFATPSGRRVFSGTYVVSDTPLALFVRSVTPLHTAQVFVTDSAGKVVAGKDPIADGRPLSAIDANLAHLRVHTAFTGSGDERRFVSSTPITGTPWRLTLTVRTSELYAPLDTPARWLSWLALAAFALITLLALGVLYPYLTQRARLVDSESRHRAILNTANDAFVSMDSDGVIIAWNTAATRLLDWGADEAIGQPLVTLLVPPENRQAHLAGVGRFLATGQTALPTGGVPVEAMRRDGSRLMVELTLTRMPWAAGWQFHAFLRDISERLEHETQLRHLALTDSLTGLSNRRAALDRLDQALARAQRHSQPVAALYIDVDHFKSINDTHGHAAGDMVLVDLARRLGTIFRTEDTLARMGGDEFLVICEDLADVDAARELADRTRTELAQPYLIGEELLVVTASIGLALSDETATTQSLIALADTHMYAAKSSQRPGTSDPGA